MIDGSRRWRHRRLPWLFAVLALWPVAARSLVSVPAHPVHVSSTQVDLSTDERRLEITVRIFTDDLEEALSRAGVRVAVNSAPAVQVDSAIAGYLRPRVRFSVDGTPAVSGRLIGHEREDDATLCYIEVPVRAAPRSLTIEQAVLLDLFEDQTNILHYKAGPVKRSALLRRGSERATFTLP